MAEPRELSASQLRVPCPVSEIGFELSSQAPAGPVTLGQQRALDAIAFGLEMRRDGYNLFVLGATGSGRAKLTQQLVEQRAFGAEVPSDYCYVHNFAAARKPKLLCLPAGQGTRLRAHMERALNDLPMLLSAAPDNQSYRERREAIEREISQRHERELERVGEAAATRDVAVARLPSGIMLMPMRDGKVLEDAEREALSAQEQARFEQNARAVHEELQAVLHNLPRLQREQRERVRALDRGIVHALVEEQLSDLRRGFAQLPQVLEHLLLVGADIVERAPEIVRASDPQHGSPLPFWSESDDADGVLRRYRVNLLVDHGPSHGAPMVVLDHPTSANLVGKVEHLSQFGVLISDFNMIKAGALHRANGGFLIVDARRLLMQPVAYDQLKRCLRTREIRIESVAEALDLAAGTTQEPEPVPFAGKVILIGEPWLYHELCARDPEFPELFKVAADFEPDVPRSAEATRAYAQLLAAVSQREQLRPFQASAIACLLEEASRTAEDATRYSMHVRRSFDLLREADHWAGRAAREQVTAQDVDQAIRSRALRHAGLRERVQRSIAEGTIRVETRGERVGQINGLSVVDLGESRFGFPTRITAQARLGTGEVLDVQREVKLSGPVHSKGVLILTSFVGARYQRDRPLSLRASLVFEQTYGLVEGDSASLAELLALLSAIGELPIRQSVAVTGSVDQHGHVQPVGGVNDKIEGMFELCKAHGLDGSHGVIIPSSNARHLMLRNEVLAAVEQGRFHIWTVDQVDDAMPLLFGLPAGVREGSAYTQGSANQRVDARLAALHATTLELARQARAPS